MISLASYGRRAALAAVAVAGSSGLSGASGFNYTQIPFNESVTPVYIVWNGGEATIFLLAIIAFCSAFELICNIWSWFVSGSD